MSRTRSAHPLRPVALKPGRFDNPVSQLDRFPTVVAATTGAVPKEITLDGVNLVPYFKGEAMMLLADRTLFWRIGGGEKFPKRKGPYNLVRVCKKHAVLFDLSADIAKKAELVGTKADTIVGLKKELDSSNATLMELKWAPQNATLKK